MHHYECIAPNVDIIIRSGQFWATSVALFKDRFTDFRSCWVVFIQVVRGHPGGLLQFSKGETVRSAWHLIHLTFTLYVAKQINEVTLCQARLVLGWVTVYWQEKTILVCNSHRGQLSLLPSVKWVSALGLSNNNKWRWWIRFTGCLSIGRPAVPADWLGPKVGGHLAPLLYSSREPSELSQWLCRDDSTINIVVVIIIIINIAVLQWSASAGITEPA